MLSGFDWLRRSRSGTELLATLTYLAEASDAPVNGEKMGPPHSALHSPCVRCWIYPREGNKHHCKTCHAILGRGRRLFRLSPHALLIWGFVNRLPVLLRGRAETRETHAIGSYVHDAHHFLLVIRRRHLKIWLQELVIHHGDDLKGVLQIFPSMPPRPPILMGDILCWAVHYEAYLPMDRMYVRFYSAPSQVIEPHKRDQQGRLNFEIAEFLGLLETAEVFRTLLRPEEQKELFELLTLDNLREEQFYWGRFLGRLEQQAKDMLTAWGIRTWAPNRIRLLYELFDYVDLSRFH